MRIKNLKRFLHKKNNKKIFIICGKRSFLKINGKSFLDKKITKKSKIYYYFKISNNPDYDELKTIVSKINKFTPNLIIAIGGGCVMDYAKSANVLAFENKSNVELDKKFNNKFCRLICIPTTAGTGAETTPSAVLYVNNKKTNISGPAVKPDYYFFEPKFIKYNNNYTIASSGFDTLSQSIESILSIKATQQSIYLAKKSINLSINNLINFYEKKKISNAINLITAANLSGRAISISNTGVPHALSYIFSSNFKLSHGHSVSLNTLKVIKFNFLHKKKSKLLEKRLNIIFKIFSCNDYYDFEKKIKFILKKINLEQNYKNLNISENRLLKLKKFISKKRLENNIIKLNSKNIDQILFNLF